MYPNSTNSETHSGYTSFDRPNYSRDHAYSYSHSRLPGDQAQPVSQRPPLHPSYSDSPAPQRWPEVYSGPSPRPEYPPQCQNLPGLRDILSPVSQGHGHTSYGTQWNANTSPSTNYYGREDYLAARGLHPPMVLHPPMDPYPRTQPPQSSAFEVPILATSPVSKQPSRSVPVSPYSPYPDSGYDRTEMRQDVASRTPITSATPVNNDVRGQFHLPPNDEPHSRPRSSYAQAGTESHGKFLGVRDLPGEGSFFIYEDGHRIPTHVDGEQVNPAWGLTKANKPRKRLALACLDCREKKIKCEPGLNSCLQCEKAMRPCRRAPQQHSHTDIPSAPPTIGAAVSPPRKNASNSDPTPIVHRDAETEAVNKRRTRDDSSPPNVPTKRHRSVSPMPPAQQLDPHSREDAGWPLPDAPGRIHNSPGFPDKSSLSWEEDPYEVDPELTVHLLELYFAHVNNAVLCMFPRNYIIDWAQTCTGKCQNERLVLYAMLAAASVFADSRLSGVGRLCARIAGDALSTQSGRFHASLVQARLLLALYHFAKGSNGMAWDLTGSAIRTVSYMRLNTEEGCLDDEASKAQSRYEFSFSPEQLAECKRRTFWSCFLSDRLCAASACILKPEDVFVRLPCADDMFERGVQSDAPYFSNSVIDPVAAILTPASPLAPMAWLAMVAAIWGDVSDFVFRASHRAPDAYKDDYEAFYENTWNRLRGWSTRLPEHLTYSEAHLDESVQKGYGGTFVVMHILYHYSLMKLNRGLRHELIPESLSRNIRETLCHGHEILQIVAALASSQARDSLAPAEGKRPTFEFSAPIIGFATLSAIDVVSAGGPDSNLGATITEIDSGLTCLRELSKYWESAKSQLKVCQTRYHQIQNVLRSPQKARSGAWLSRKWGMQLPLEQDLEPGNDCMYGLGDSAEAIELYFNAFREANGYEKAPVGGLRIA